MANRGMQFDLRIIHDGEERQVTAGPPTIVAFERKWGMGWGKAMQDVHVEHIAWVAHDALHKAALMGNGTAVKRFDDWINDLEEIEIVDEDSAPLGGTQ